MNLSDILSTLEVPREESKLTQDEIRMITSISFVGGSPVFTAGNIPLLYELISSLHDQTVEEATQAIQQMIDTTTRRISPGDAIFSTPLFQKEREKYDSETDKLRNRVLIIEGIYPCGHCKSKSTVTMEMQTRSGDEAIDVITTCMACGKKS